MHLESWHLNEAVGRDTAKEARAVTTRGMDKRGRQWSGVGLRVARALLVLVALALLATWIASLPEYFRRASTLTIPTFERAGVVVASNEMMEEAAIARGLSLVSYLIYEIGLSLLSIGIFFGVAGLLVWRAKRSWFGWLTALVFVGIGAVQMTQVLQVAHSPTGILLTVEVASWLVWPVMFLWIYLFPSGSATPRWTRAPVGILLASFGIGAMAGFLASLGKLPNYPERLFSQISPVIGVGLLGLIAYSQIYRYRHVYSSVEREQVKWFVFAVVVLLAEVMVFVAFESAGLQASAVFQDVSGLLLLVLPLSVGFAVLRYRLYDIDLIINRTLVYVPLTAIVAGLMAAGIKFSQTALVAITGQESDIAVVAATFLVVSLATPIRNRLQAVVDRAFGDTGEAERRLGEFTERVSEVVEIVDPRRIGRRAVDECVAALGAESGAIYQLKGNRRILVFESDGWRGRTEIEVPIADESGPLGILCLCRRKSGAPYSAGDLQAVESLAQAIAPALGWGKPQVSAIRRNSGAGKAGHSGRPRGKKAGHG
jgi:uncharacterized membrane protein YidH (DUF202 family)